MQEEELERLRWMAPAAAPMMQTVSAASCGAAAGECKSRGVARFGMEESFKEQNKGKDDEEHEVHSRTTCPSPLSQFPAFILYRNPLLHYPLLALPAIFLCPPLSHSVTFFPLSPAIFFLPRHSLFYYPFLGRSSNPLQSSLSFISSPLLSSSFLPNHLLLSGPCPLDMA